MKTLQLPFLFALVGSLCAAESVPRIGILSDAGARREADLLMLELQKARCELVERDEISKVLGEQTMQAILSRAGSQRIGRLLKADGLVLLSAIRPGQISFRYSLLEGSNKREVHTTNQTLMVRLIAVEPGVLTYLAESPVDAPGWATNTAAALTECFPKLSVKANAATPVSLLRVRPTNGFASSILLANDISPLLWQRLAKEPSLFVLDRENLDRVVEEAQWNGQEPGFWAGSVLVEGRASHDLANTNGALLTLSVQRPVAGSNTLTRTEWTETGELTDLPGLVERAATRLRQEIGTRVNDVPWDPQAEGRRLLSIVPHLVDPRQQKAAIGTAMSLGCRDGKTANEYRVALRSIAYRDAVRFSDVTLHLASGSELEEQARDFLELIRFHNDYRPPEGFSREETPWHKGGQEATWLFAYFQPMKDIETFLDAVKGSKRQDAIRPQIREIQTECQRTADRLWAIDPYCRDIWQGQVPIQNARYRYTTMREILDIYRRWAFAPRTNDNYSVTGITGGLWFLERQRAEPVFTDSRTESAAERDRLWQEFEQQLSTADRPAIRINLALRDLHQAKAPDQQRDARGRLQQVLAECAVAFATAPDYADYTGLYNEAYPTNVVVTPAQTCPRLVPAVTKPLSTDELAANARAAHRLFLAITPTNSLRAADFNCLIRPYLDYLTENDLRPVYQITRDYQYQSIYRRIDTFVLQQMLGERFPALLDDAHRAERARRQAMFQPSTAPSMLPRECLFVTNSISLSPDPARKPGRMVAYQWRGDILRLIWDNEYFHVDPVRRTYQSVPLLPPQESSSANIVDVNWQDNSVQLIRPGDWLTVDAARRTCERVVFPSPPEKSAEEIHGMHRFDGSIGLVRNGDFLLVDTVRRACERIAFPPPPEKGAGRIHNVHWMDGAVRLVRGGDVLIVDIAGRTCERVVLPSLPGGGPGTINGVRWLDESVQLIRDGHFVVVDTCRHAVERIDPPPETEYPGQGKWTPSLTAADSLLVLLKPFDMGSNMDRPGTWMAWRPATGGDWRVARLTFGVGSVAWLNGKFYFTTGAPRIVVYQGGGVIEYDPETDKCVTLRAPGTPLARRDKGDRNKPMTFENLSFGLGTRDGLLCGMMGQRLYGWDPVTKAVKDLTPPKSPPPPDKPPNGCRAFGFEIPDEPPLRSSSYWLSIPVAGQIVTRRLEVTQKSGKFMSSIPLCFPRMPTAESPDAKSGVDRGDPPADAQETGLAGPSFLLVPYESWRALHVIPYADIQQWLAANSPAADKPTSQPK